MQLTMPLKSHIAEMMTWFVNENELKQWSGPGFRYPFDLSSFSEDLNITPPNSFSLISDNNELLGFGQFYQRLDKCHLGRLVVNPEYRGKGIASELISRISEHGENSLSVSASSLFVLSHNKSAVKVYQNSGFVLSEYPDEIPLADCLYMIKTK